MSVAIYDLVFATAPWEQVTLLVRLRWMRKEAVAEMMRILVATDGSSHAIGAAKLAARLARELREAEVVLVNVGHIPSIALSGPGASVDFAALEEGLQQAGKAILEQTAAALASTGARVSRVYRWGDPAGEIIKVAQEQKADLIIMGSRGLGQIGGLILGSVSGTGAAWGARSRPDRPVGKIESDGADPEG